MAVTKAARKRKLASISCRLKVFVSSARHSCSPTTSSSARWSSSFPRLRTSRPKLLPSHRISSSTDSYSDTKRALRKATLAKATTKYEPAKGLQFYSI